MAKGNSHNPPQSAHSVAVEPQRSGGQLVEFDEFIDAQLGKTRSHVRSVDVASSLMLLTAGTLGYLLLAAMFDHWIVSGGLGFWGRISFLAVYVVGAVAFLVTQVLPLLVYRINPLYAAQTIERSQPSLKNTLVNFLFFRGNPAGVNPGIYRAVEQQAATNLAAAHADTAVDRTKLIRIGYVLIGIFVVCALYTLASPKDLFKTAGRIAAPWADIDAPTRTTITGIEPRDTQAFRGQQIEVSARIQDSGDGGRVMLYYSTADGQIVDSPIEMSLGDDRYDHTCLLPAGEASLQQDLHYRIEAGDAITRPFYVEVVAAPTIFVRALDYKYPTYTGLLARRVERLGDIKAIEGTEVTLEALANSEIQSAHVDFDCDGTLDQRMTVDALRAKVTFRLALEEDRKTPWHGSYQLVFKNVEGQQNPQPVRHQIEVTRDLSPEIEFVEPQKAEIDLPANGSVTWEVVANDPDFALRMVKLSAAKGGQPLFDKLVLDETHRGQFVAKFRFEPAKLGLEPGDVVEYSALAEDNKSPRPNRTETLPRKIRIVSPSEQAGGQDQVAQNDQQGKGRQQPGDRQQQGQDESPRDGEQSPEEQDPSRGGDGQQGDSQGKPGEQQPDGQQGEGQQREGQEGQTGKSGDDTGQQGQGEDRGQGEQQQQGESSVPSDGSNDGDAIERILEHRQQQEGNDSKASDRQQESSQQQSGSEKQSGDREARQQPGPKQRGDDKQQQGGEQGKAGSEQRQRATDAGDKRQDTPSSERTQQEDQEGAKGDQSGDRDEKQPEERSRGDRKGQPSGDAQQKDEQDASQQDRRESEPSEKSPPEAPQRDEESEQGQGAQSKSDPMTGQDPQSRDSQSRDGQRPDSKGGGQQNKGQSGAGKKGQEQQGSPTSQEQNQPRGKSERPEGANETPEEPDQEQSPSNSKRESDSEGQDDGDRSGGGKRGGGQKANKPGTGGAGKNTPADEGAGASEQAGEGETSDRAGGDQAADGETGQSGSQAGKGSQDKSANDPGGKPGSAGASDSPGERAAENPPTGKDGTSGGEPTGGQPGGQPGEPPTGAPPSGPEVADDANLEYTRKATDLALSHLKDELAKDKPDADLLDRLGWSRDDLERFVNRWEQMRASAKSSGEKGESAKRELDETLRSLGLRPKTTSLRSKDARDDQFKGLRESRRSSPPPEYAEQTKAYTQGTARGGK